jgi:hypothetical protein
MTPEGAQAKPRWPRLAALLLCACASLWLYRATVRLVPRLTSAEPTGAGEVFPWVKPLTHATLDSIQHKTHGIAYTFQFAACYLALFALYAVIVRLTRGAPARWFMPVAAMASATFMAVLLYSPAMLSSDVYAYAHYGRLLAVKGIDAHGPAAVAAADTDKDDPFSLDGYYDFVASVYGPFWTVISAGLVLIGRGHVGLTVLLFRGLEAASALGCGGFIWLILHRLAPERAALGAVLFLWNPLVITESAMGGHNDTCMMLFALLAIWLHLRGWKAGAVVALTLSALVKVITAPLVPLYMLMIWRRSPDWKHAASFLARAGIGAAAAVVLSAVVARMNPSGLIVHTASAAQFYENNYHELLFKGLRRLLGEPADSIEAPMDFKTYWVQTCTPAVLHAGPANKSTDLARLSPGQPLLVISDEDSDEWLRLYDPIDRLQGYIEWPRLNVIDQPKNAGRDPAVARLSGWPPDWPTVATANRWIRIVTWTLFAAFGLMAAWKTTDFDRFLWWSAAFFLAAELLVFTKIWPWYAVWPLALGVLKPLSSPARLAILLSGGMGLLYPLLDYSGTQWYWVNDCRSIPTIVLPVAIFLLTQAWRIAASRRPAPESGAQLTPEAAAR